MRRRLSPDYQTWIVVGFFLAASAAVFATQGFVLDSIDAFSAIAPLATASLLSVVALVRFPRSRLARIISAIVQLSICGMATAMLALSAGRIANPLIDTSLLRFDRLIGYDWRTFTSLVSGSRELEHILSWAYSSLFWQPLFVVTALATGSDERDLNRYVMSYIVVLLLAVAIFAIWPATTAWHQLGIAPSEVANRHLQASLEWTNSLMQIRSGATIKVSAHSSFAIIGFPSFHCAAAILNASALAGSRLRFPITALNTLMILATPMMGGHYVADIFGAMIVTTIAVAVTSRLYVDQSPVSVEASALTPSALEPQPEGQPVVRATRSPNPIQLAA